MTVDTPGSDSVFHKVTPTLIEPPRLTDIVEPTIVEKDFLHLYSLRDETTLWLFPSRTKHHSGKMMPDTGATQNYVDRKYLLNCHVDYTPFTVTKEVSVAGGYTIHVYGTCKLPIEVSGWMDVVDVYVVDLDAEFDVVLG